MTKHLFPILVDWHDRSGAMALRSIPWAMLTEHQPQAVKNHDQDLEKLASRGGLAPCEAVAVLEDRPWRFMPLHEATDKLRALVDAFERRQEKSE